MVAGRRRLLYTASTLSGIAGVMCCTAPSLWLYMLFRGLTGLATGGLGLAAFAVGTESCGPSWRSLAGLLLQVSGSGCSPQGLGPLCFRCDRYLRGVHGLAGPEYGVGWHGATKAGACAYGGHLGL